MQRRMLKKFAETLVRHLHENPQQENEILRAGIRMLREQNVDVRAEDLINDVKLLLAKHKGGSVVDIEYARAITEVARKEIQALFSANEVIRESINPALLAGIRITYDGKKEIDASLKRKLSAL